MAANVPGVHGTGAVAPTLHAAPLVQAWHSSAVVSLLVLPKRPDGHGRAAGEPSGQKPPTSHGAGTMVALPQVLPAGHSPEHRALDCASTLRVLPKSPAAHALG